MPKRSNINQNILPRDSLLRPDRATPEYEENEEEGGSGKTATHYRMNHRRRGVAAIFNQEHFQDSNVNERRGSRHDVTSLTSSFSRLGFEVETHLDLNCSEIFEALDELSQRDHSECDCFVLVFMSHGQEGKLRARDAIFDINTLWHFFTAEICPTLANKPKLFFIQACQGHGRQKGVEIYESSEDPEPTIEEGGNLIPSYLLPNRADFLVAFSTIPGFVSWRSPETGSWYIQTLCRHLDSMGFTEDILSLLTHVGRFVALNFSQCNNEGTDCRTQLPFVLTLLIRKLRFTRKNRTKLCGRSKTWEEDLMANEEFDGIPNDHGTRSCRARRRRRSHSIRRDSSVSPKRKRRRNFD